MKLLFKYKQNKTMKVFDKEVKQCADCVFSFGKSENNTSPYLYCGQIKEYLDDNGTDFIHKNCPFKDENSFTKEQFRSIGFKLDRVIKFTDEQLKTCPANYPVKYYINNIRCNKSNEFQNRSKSFPQEGDIQKTITQNADGSFCLQIERFDTGLDIRWHEFKATSFLHLKFILDSLI